MNHLLILASNGAESTANPIASLLPFLLIGLVFYFLIIRPQRKRQNEQKEMIKALGVGDDIVTIGGFHGTIVDADDDSFDLEIAQGVIVTIARNAVSKALNPTVAAADDDDFDSDFDELDGDDELADELADGTIDADDDTR